MSRVGLTTRPLGRNEQGNFANVHAAMLSDRVDPATLSVVVFLEPFQGFPEDARYGRLAINISTRIRFERFWANVQSSRCRQRAACSSAVHFRFDQCGQNGHGSFFLIRATVVASR